MPTWRSIKRAARARWASLGSAFDRADSLRLPAPRHETRQLILAGVTALVSSLVFFLPSLLDKSLNAGFVYSDDVYNGYLPFTQKMADLIAHGALTGIDFSTHGGASDFFLRANLWGYNPVLLALNFFRHPQSAEKTIQVLAVCLFLYSLAGVFFTYRLADRYLGLGSGASVFVSVGFIFSADAVYALYEPSFLLSAWLLPAMVYGGLRFRDRGGLVSLLFAALPAWLVLNSGYAPLGAASLLFAAVTLIAFNLLVGGPAVPAGGKAAATLRALAPLALAGLITLPLYLDYLQYNGLVRNSADSVFFAAHQLASTPSTALHAIGMFYSPRANWENTPVFGLVPISIGLLYFLGLKRRETSAANRRFFLFAGLCYCFVLFATFGDFSVISDLVYYIPFVGGMHIYQRHLLAGHLFFMLAAAMALKTVSAREINWAHKTMLAILFLALALVLFLMNFNAPAAASVNLNEYVVLDLCFALAFVAVLFFRLENAAFLAATVLILLDPLNAMYNNSTKDTIRYQAQKSQQLNLDDFSNARLIDYLQKNCGKQIIKYVDLVSGAPNPFPINYMSPNYPWFAGQRINLSSYGGYDFHVSVRRSYSETMPYKYVDGRWRMHPDWSWLLRTGADFVVWDAGYEAKEPGLAMYADLSDPARVLRLPNGLTVAPFKARKPSFERAGLQGRYVRIQLSDKEYLSLAEVRVMGTIDGKPANLALGKAATQSSNITTTALAAVAVDGITDGDYAHGSVTHTGNDQNPWWQVDLGQDYPIDSVEVWNRTDSGTSSRLRDFWVFVSDTPFPAAGGLDSLLADQGIVKAHVIAIPSPSLLIPAFWDSEAYRKAAAWDNGYLRVLGDLTLTRIDGFRTNNASSLDLQFTSQAPTRVEYLFWPNEHMEWFDNGQRMIPQIADGLEGLSLPPGSHRLELRYRAPRSELFVWLSFLYAGLLAAAGGYTVVSRFRRGWPKPSGREPGPAPE